jgi:GTP-binding protein
MNIATAKFECSAPDLETCPDETLPEFAFIGRSNVGKSSLLNMLSGEQDLARVSATPGHTRLINFFRMNKTWRLVDLPGYGYAHGARKEREQFNRAVMRYLQHRPNLSCVFTLIDSSLPPQPIDLEFIQWLASKSVPFVLVFTKTDTGDAETVAANMRSFTEAIATWFEQAPTVFTCSATTRHGRSELLEMIGGILEAIEKEAGEATPPPAPVEPPPPEPEPPFRIQVRAGSEKERTPRDKRGLKSARPW